MTGPVQVLVLGFDELAVSGEVLDELVRLREAGVVRLVDLVVVERDAAGDFEVVPTSDRLGVEVGGAAARLLGELTEQPSAPALHDVDGWSLGDVVPPGSVAAVALLEHVWAGPLADAVARAGGQALDEFWLSPADRDALSGLLADVTDLPRSES